MAVPVFIVAAREVVEDKSTNLLTIVNVVENITANVGTPSAPATFIPFLSAVAVWRQEDADEGQAMDVEFAILLNGRELAVSQGGFRFEEGKLLWRGILRFPMNIADPVAIEDERGWIVLESRVKRSESQEWSRQQYPIKFNVVRHGEVPPQ